MANILADVGLFANQTLTTGGGIVTFVTENPLCLLGVVSMVGVTMFSIIRHLIRGV